MFVVSMFCSFLLDDFVFLSEDVGKFFYLLGLSGTFLCFLIC